MAPSSTLGIIEFEICEGNQSVFFKTIYNTPIVKVWKAYVARRGWSAEEAQIKRLFTVDDDPISLHTSVGPAGIKNGDKVMVYDLDEVGLPCRNRVGISPRTSSMDKRSAE